MFINQIQLLPNFILLIIVRLILRLKIEKLSIFLNNNLYIYLLTILYLDGLLYFVEGATIGSDFGFPRLGIRKRFKWKKMNFTTDLPKRDPLVSYIVASAVKCEKFFPGSNDDGPVYRMHAVILKKKDPKL